MWVSIWFPAVALSTPLSPQTGGEAQRDGVSAGAWASVTPVPPVLIDVFPHLLCHLLLCPESIEVEEFSFIYSLMDP